MVVFFGGLELEKLRWELQNCAGNFDWLLSPAGTQSDWKNWHAGSNTLWQQTPFWSWTHPLVLDAPFWSWTHPLVLDALWPRSVLFVLGGVLWQAGAVCLEVRLEAGLAKGPSWHLGRGLPGARAEARDVDPVGGGALLDAVLEESLEGKLAVFPGAGLADPLRAGWSLCFWDWQRWWRCWRERCWLSRGHVLDVDHHRRRRRRWRLAARANSHDWRAGGSVHDWEGLVQTGKACSKLATDFVCFLVC